ncbi:hypothetical protein LB504_009357 [Fusarium proliferatum]|nr:hypothetical protein LB504_009357 [Fusarium proliferatum]
MDLVSSQMSEAISLALAALYHPARRSATAICDAGLRGTRAIYFVLHLHFQLRLYYRSNSITLGIAALKVVGRLDQVITRCEL